jgi:hypothetical protein
MRVRAVKVYEASLPDVKDYYYDDGDPLFQITTV